MNSRESVAVASRSFSNNAALRAELHSVYQTVVFNETDRVLSGSELAGFLEGHVKAIIGLDRLDEAVLAALPDLRVVSKYGVGLDNLDLEALRRHGIRLGWTGGVNKRAVAELVIAFAIGLLRHIPDVNQEVRAGRWKPRVGRELSGRTVGIVGCGHVGKELVSLLIPFGCRILAHDILDFPEFYSEHRVAPVQLEQLLAESDIVTLHLPLNPSTRNILSRDRLALMKSNAILINTARGGLVDEAALKFLLLNDRLGGAGFDVFATEPPEDTELLNLSNFICTPHVGGSTEESQLAMGRAAIAGLDTARIP